MKSLVELAESFNLQGKAINRDYEVNKTSIQQAYSKQSYSNEYNLCDEPGTNCDCIGDPSDCDCTSDDCDND